MPYVHLDAGVVGRSAGDDLPLTDAENHHLRRVLRLRPGADLEVSDGVGGVAPALLTLDGAELQADPAVLPPRAPRLCVAQALPKGRKLDEVVRQITELGVDEIVPIEAERSVVRAGGERAERIRARSELVARAAAEQARSPWRPIVHPVVGIAGLGQRSTSQGDAWPLVLTHPFGPPLPDVLESFGSLAGITLVVGPEGGWSEREVAELTRAGAVLAGLGPTVLRTEHAAAAGIAVTAAWVGRWS